MASSKEFRDYVLEQLEGLGVTSKPMMGEYLLYKGGIYFGGVCDDRMLVKIVKENEKYGMERQCPYDGAKQMYLVHDVDDRERLAQIVIDTCIWIKIINKHSNTTYLRRADRLAVFKGCEKRR